MIRIGYLSDFPYFVGFGGKEILLNLYRNYINKFYCDIEVELVDYFNKNAQYEIIHLFGYSNWFYDIVKTLKANKPNIKIIISPNFYSQEELRLF